MVSVSLSSWRCAHGFGVVVCGFLYIAILKRYITPPLTAMTARSDIPRSVPRLFVIRHGECPEKEQLPKKETRTSHRRDGLVIEWVDLSTNYSNTPQTNLTPANCSF